MTLPLKKPLSLAARKQAGRAVPAILTATGCVAVGLAALFVFGTGAPAASHEVVKQAVGIQQAFGDMMARGVSPGRVELSELVAEGLVSLPALPKGALTGPEAEPWRLLAVRTEDSRRLGPETVLAAVSAPLSHSVCEGTRRMVGVTASKWDAALAAGGYSGSGAEGEPALVRYSLEHRVSGCVTDAEGRTFYVHPVHLLEAKSAAPKP